MYTAHQQSIYWTKKIFAKRLDTTTLKKMLNMRIEDERKKSAQPKQ
jgi:hypothetical protein